MATTQLENERWPREQVLEMHDEFIHGKSLRKLGEEHGISHEGVRQLFLENGLETKRPRKQTVDRYATQYAAWSAKEEIWELYRKHGNIEDVAEEIGIPAPLISPVIDRMPMREVYTNRRSGSRYTKEEIYEVLRAVAKLKGEPLTQPAYQEGVEEHNRQAKDDEKWPTRPTIVAVCDSFAAACKGAGVKHNPSRGPRLGSFTEEDCFAAIRQCLADLGRIPRYEDYEKWARDKQGAPSGATLRVIAGPWRKAVGKALRTDFVGWPD